MVIPHFGDQWANAAEIVRVGTGIQVDLHGLNTTVMSNAIMKLLSDQSFTQRSLKLRNILLDQVRFSFSPCVVVFLENFSSKQRCNIIDEHTSGESSVVAGIFGQAPRVPK